MRTRIKICGITRIGDALAAAAAGADAIGLVFDPKSPRYVETKQAVAIVQALPPYISVVGLFVDATPQAVRDVLNRVNLSLLQFHGNETPEYCRAFSKPYVKAVHMTHAVDLHVQARRFTEAAGLLLDSFSATASGGTGQTFDWNRVPGDLKMPVVLAGGLTPENVVDAIHRVHPYAVDVSSGVESAKGIKDAKKITAFIKAVKGTAT